MRRVTLTAAVIVCAARLEAHSLLVTRGDAVVDRGGVTVRLEVCAEDVVHHQPSLQGSEDAISVASLREAADRHAAALAERLIVLTATGDRLTAGPPRWSMPPCDAESIDLASLRTVFVAYTLSYGSEEPHGFLTFRLVPNDQAIGVAEQIGLWVHGRSGDRGVSIRLTSRGNAETVAVSWEEGRPTAVARDIVDLDDPLNCSPDGGMDGSRFKDLWAEIDLNGPDMWVTIYAPAPLLGTWLPVKRGAEDVLTPAEQTELLAAAVPLLEGALAVTIDGAEVTPSVEWVVLLPAGIRVLEDANGAVGAGNVCFWTARAAVRLRFAGREPPEEVGLEWRLFNNVVLSVPAAIRLDGECVHHTFTTYAPAMTWRRSG